MFFRSAKTFLKANARHHGEFIKDAAKTYVTVGAYGASLGGFLGAFFGVGTSPINYLEGYQYSEKKNLAGKVYDGLESSVKVFSEFTATGALIGGALITFPIVGTINSYQERKSLKK